MYINSSQLAKMFQRQFQKTETNVNKAMNRLSSGLKVNSAADDAAGLAISQKLIAQLRGSSQAVKNTRDASSLVQTADGAIQEISGIINRIKELTIQAMNGTYTEPNQQGTNMTIADKIIIQSEVDELKKVLHDIVKGTEFNTMKLLTNETPKNYMYENKVLTSGFQLSQQANIEKNELVNKIENVQSTPQSVNSITSTERNPVTSIISVPSLTYVATTINDHTPRFTLDGNEVVFYSSRDGGQYIVSAEGGSNPQEATSTKTAPQKTQTDNGLYRLRQSPVNGNLLFEKRSSTSSSNWQEIGAFDYNKNNGSTGYSFAPTVDQNGHTSFVYSDNVGNIVKVDFNIFTGVINGSTELIPNTDTLHIPPKNNIIALSSTPELYRMNTEHASLRIRKVNDDGSRELTYWDAIGTPPTGGYYTVSGNKVEFFDEAIIGKEPVDDAQDYYLIDHVDDGNQDGVFTKSFPPHIEIYHMNGSDGPRSLNITIGGVKVSREQLLDSRPTDIDGVTGVYVDAESNQIEIYGDLRPSYWEDVRITYLRDEDGARNEAHSVSIPTNIDTYNLTEDDLTKNRSLRVYVGDREVKYDGSRTDGFVYENGYIKLYGNSRPDISNGELIKIKYIEDKSSTSKEVYGIPLTETPEIYNLGQDGVPNSIRVFRNGTEEIAFSEMDGFKYNEDTNTIELYGNSRPNVGDTYTVRMIVPKDDLNRTDEKVEIKLSSRPETYGEDVPIVFKVTVDGNEVSYDETKTNGYFYNKESNKIELYGDARPDANATSNPNISIDYVIESPVVELHNNNYDFQLNPNALDYGVGTDDESKAIRVYKDGVEVPYDEENGFTYDKNLQRVSLHGSYRPTVNDSKNSLQVFYVKEPDLRQSVPENSYIYRVTLNGQELSETTDPLGNGYYRDGNQILVVGDARPNISNATSSVDVRVEYFSAVLLNDEMSIAYPGGSFSLKAEIDPESIEVYLDNTLLDDSQYNLNGNQLVLNRDHVQLTSVNHQLKVNYRVRMGTEFEANQFTFQVGAHAAQNLKLSIESFDNMLLLTNKVSVLHYDVATEGLQLLERAHQFALKELGYIGAMENRLDHIANSLQITTETTTSAVSGIQDADIAKESMKLVKEQILIQAQQALAAQTNQNRQQVLQLLR